MALLESIGSEREYSCQKLCSEAGVTKGTVSHHVRELVRAGLIEERRDGQYMFYELRREVLAAYVAELMSRVARVGKRLSEPHALRSSAVVLHLRAEFGAKLPIRV